jgi:hypothetical protein
MTKARRHNTGNCLMLTQKWNDKTKAKQQNNHKKYIGYSVNTSKPS